LERLRKKFDGSGGKLGGRLRNLYIRGGKLQSYGGKLQSYGGKLLNFGVRFYGYLRKVTR
jgi:hypothetical protein